MRNDLVKQNCEFAVMRPAIEAGATLKHLYQRRDGSEIGTVTVTQQLCEF